MKFINKIKVDKNLFKNILKTLKILFIKLKKFLL
jgi:hypothetical protein